MTDMPLDLVTITRDDLDVVAEAVVIRLPLREPESRRVAQVRRLLAASTELHKLLSLQTQHALVDCYGTHGTGDVIAETAALYEALRVYAAAVRSVAEEYRRTVPEIREPDCYATVPGGLGSQQASQPAA